MALTKDTVEKLEKVTGQVEGLHREITALARKSPNDAVNKFKLKFINGAIREANGVLGEKYKPVDGFDAFEEDEIPTNSDVTFILAQYAEELERLRADNIRRHTGLWIYDLSGSADNIRTAPPKKISEKK